MRSATIIAVGLVAAAGIGGGAYVGATALHSPGQRTVPAASQSATTAAHTTTTVASTTVVTSGATTAAPTTGPAKPSADVQASADARQACTILSIYDRSEAPVIAALVAQGTNATIGGLIFTPPVGTNPGATAIERANSAAHEAFAAYLSGHPASNPNNPTVYLSGLFHELWFDINPSNPDSVSSAKRTNDYTNVANDCRNTYELSFPTLAP